jgi:uncharacterized protein YndB with AHSA1/START domain
MNTEKHVIKENELYLKRVVGYSRERVFRAMTDPEQLIQWFGPDGFTNTFHEFELKPGGVWRFIMHGPDGTNYDNRVIFEEIIFPSRLVYMQDSDKEDDPGEFHTTIDFRDLEGKTEISVVMRFKTAERLQYTIKEFGAIEGWEQHIGRLEEFLKQNA